MKELILPLSHYVLSTLRPSLSESSARRSKAKADRPSPPASHSGLALSAHKPRARFPALTAKVALALLAFGFDAQAANTADNYTGSSTDSLLTPGNWSLGSVPTVGNDAVFTVTPGIRTLGTGATVGNLTVGSFDVTASSGTFAIGNNTSTATDTILTLGGSGNLGNGVSGTAGDLLYVASGSTFNIIGPNGSTGSGVLKLVLGQSGSFKAAGTLNITAAVSDGGSAFGFTKTGAGSLTLSGANTYSGGTTIVSGTLALGVANALPTGTTVTFGASGAAGTLDLAGLNQQVAGLAVASGATAASQIIGNSSKANNATLTYGGGSSTFGGIIQNTLGSGSKTVILTVSVGNLTLSGANTYSGGTMVNGGTLSVSTDGNLGAVPGAATANSITINGGTLSLAPTATLTLNANRGITIGSSGGMIGVTTAQVVLYGGIISGAGNTLTYTGISGSEFRTYSANNTFGKLVISGGMYTAGYYGTNGSDLSFGAVPSIVTPDAITLQNGANMRANNSPGITLNANRGITLGSGGGVFGISSGFLCF